MLLQSQSTIGSTLSVYTVRILSFTASISGPARIIDTIRQAFPPPLRWPTTSTDTSPARLLVRHIDDTDDTWCLVDGDAHVSRVHGFDNLQTLLIWLINSKAVGRLSSDYLLFHAGAVAIGATGIILPGVSGSGKSTLTAALIARGFTYFSDEAAVVDLDHGSLLPFPKAIKIEPGSLPFLADLYPELTGDGNDARTFLCPPNDVWPEAPARPAYIIFPRYEAGARTCLNALPRAEGFARLLDHSFSARGHAAAGVEQIVRLLQRCECYHLTVGDLDAAADAVLRLALGMPERDST